MAEGETRQRAEECNARSACRIYGGQQAVPVREQPQIIRSPTGPE